MARLELCLLGPCQFTLNGAVIAQVESNKARSLMAFLAVEHHYPRARDGLADLLWPDSPNRAARSNFRRALANLRSAIGDRAAHPPHLFVTRNTVQFNVASDAIVDVVRFTHLIRSSETQPTWRENLEQAVALYRGPFLDGLYVDDCPEFEQWTTTTRTALEQLAAQAFYRLACDSEERGDIGEAQSLYLQALKFDLYDETAHRGLMRILVSRGHRNAALQHYSAFRNQLLADLGVEPEPLTADLYAAIQQGHFIAPEATIPSHGGPPIHTEQVTATRVDRFPKRPVEPDDSQDAHPPPLPARAELLLSHTPFFGREAELAHIAACLADPACRLLSVVGPGGAGKTRLAVEAVASQGKRYANGVHFVSLAAVAHAGFIADAILRALDAPVQAGPQGQLRLLDFLHDKQMLLVLDNFEHLAEGADLLLALLDAAPGIKLLVTSRARLSLRDEWLAPIEGLEAPPAAGFSADGTQPEGFPAPTAPLTWAELERYSAIQLFLHSVRRLRPGFQPSPADAPVIVRICQRLEGLPLGIELAAAWTRTLSFTAIHDGIEHNLDFLTTSVRDLPARQRGLRAVFDHSWRLLTSHQRSLLRQMAVFRGGFTPAAAGAVAGATLAELAELVDRSWMRVVANGRFDLHEPSRHYCAEKLDSEHPRESGESADAVRSRHSAHYGLFLQGEEHDLNLRREVLAEIEHEWGNVQAAWQWAVDHADVATIRQMVASLLYIGESNGWYHTLDQLFDAAIRSLRLRVKEFRRPDSTHDETVLLLIRLQYAQGMLFRHLGWLGQARRCVDENLQLLESVEPGAQRDEDALLTRFLLAWVLYLEGDFAAARARFDELEAFLAHATADLWPYAGQAGVQFWAAHAAFGLALVAWRAGDYERSRQHFIRCLALRDAMGEQRFKASNLRAYARLLVTLGDLDEAERVAQESLRLSQSFRDRVFAGFADITLGHLDLAAGRCDPARQRFTAGLAIAQETGNFQMLQETLLGLSAVELALGQADAAQRHYEESMAALRRLSLERSFYWAAVYAGLGQAALASGDRAQAEVHFRAALAIPGCSAWDAAQATAGLARLHAAESCNGTAPS